MASLAAEPENRRRNYIKALRMADKGDFGLLIEFMKEKRNPQGLFFT